MLTDLYKLTIRPLLFTMDSETIHDQTIGMLSFCARHRVLTDALSSFLAAPLMPVQAFGLHFPNPVGLAAGMDKTAAALPVWQAMGFGFCELGGVTRHPQPGNPQPRMFRAIRDRALVNRMGFNNPGAEAMAATLADWKQRGLWPSHPVGMNLGKSKITPLEEAADDYLFSFRALRDHCDFFVVNVSSPNTPNLRELQDKDQLDRILAALQEENRKRASRPILVKIAPDLSFDAIDEILELAGPRELAGIVATNTTIQRPDTNDERCRKSYSETGGLSGRPMAARATECIRHIHRQTGGKLPIVGVGGIFNAEDAKEKIDAGATLIQIYSGLVYEGPGLVKEMVTALKELGAKEK